MVVGTAKDGLLHLEYYQDAVKVVSRQYKMDSISLAIPSSLSPPHYPPSPLLVPFPLVAGEEMERSSKPPPRATIEDWSGPHHLRSWLSAFCMMSCVKGR